MIPFYEMEENTKNLEEQVFLQGTEIKGKLKAKKKEIVDILLIIFHSSTR